MSLGFDPGQFWLLTPRECSLLFAGANQRLVREHNARITQAFYTAALPNMKNPPKLSDLLIKDAKPRRAMDWQAIKASLMVALAPPESSKE